jgi:cbb3-type cytochrome oxidase subunit 3
VNHVLQEAAAQVTLGWLLGLMTVVFIGAFGFWIWWAWRGKNKARWEADSRLPFNDGGKS